MSQVSRHRFGGGICAALAVCVLCVGPAAAQGGVGRLDPAYGRSGLAITPLNTTARETGTIEIARGPDGSGVLAVGGGDLVRFRADGARDRDFGEGGELYLYGTPGDGVDLPFMGTTIAADSHGRILVFGLQANGESITVGGFGNITAYENEAAVLRFTAAGNLDPSFGESSGFISDDFGLGSGLGADFPMVSAMTGRVDSHDRPVLVAGVTSPKSGCYAKPTFGALPRAVVRLTESGQPDPSFGGGSGVSLIEGSTSFPGLGFDAADGPVVGVGATGGLRPECRGGTTIIRLGQGGERLSSFGVDGARVFKRFNLAVVEPSGGLVLSHRIGKTLLVARIRPNGRRDTSFGGGGLAKVRMPTGVGSHVSPVAVDGRGRILLAGFVGSKPVERIRREPRHSSFLVARLLRGGRLDTGLGDQGWLQTRLRDPLEITSASATLDPQGRLLVAGTVRTPRSSRSGYAIARYLLGR